MSANSQPMIAAAETDRTAAFFRGTRRARGIRAGQAVTWPLADSAGCDMTFRAAAERLHEAIELESGERLLTVSAGNTVTEFDMPERLPYRDSAFDVVVSPFAAMYLPRHLCTAHELLRVCRRGGRIGLTCWTPDSFNGQLHRQVSRYRWSAIDRTDPVSWGTRAYLNDLFGHAADALGAADRSHTWRYPSITQWLEDWKRPGGPLARIFAELDPDWRAQLSAELLALADRFNEASDGTMVVQSDYLEFLVHKSTWRV